MAQTEVRASCWAVWVGAAWLLSVVAACGGGATGNDEPGVTIISPETDSSVVRDELDDYGGLVAQVSVEVVAGGNFERVVFELDGQPVDLALESTGRYTATLVFDRAWQGELRAAIYAGEDLLDEDIANITVSEPIADNCFDWLDLYQLDYEAGPGWQGIAQPTRVFLPLNGIDYRYFWGDDLRSNLVLDCELALALARSASALRRMEVVEIRDMGLYNYRCINNAGTPPDCDIGMSQHAFGNALDIGSLVTADRQEYVVLDDWVIDPDDMPTCAAETESYADGFLHDAACAFKDQGGFHIVLTPNYNDIHRNHFHIDLAEGDDFIRRAYPVDEGIDLH